MHIMIIGNPIAGKGKTVSRIHELVRLLEPRGHQSDVFLTNKKGDARVAAGDIPESVERLVIAGGDGTVNEVLNGLPDPSRIPILHMPTGTANQLAKHLNIPSDTTRFASVLENGMVSRVDMGIAGNQRFLLQASAGFDALVTKVIEDGPRVGTGYMGYALPIVRSLALRKHSRIAVTVDGRQPLTGALVMVVKVRRYGGIFVFANEARLDSGHFDVCVFKKDTIPSLITYAAAGMARLCRIVPGIKLLRGKHVLIESEKPVPVQTDGTYYGVTPVRIEHRSGLVPVIIPRKTAYTDLRSEKYCALGSWHPSGAKSDRAIRSGGCVPADVHL